MRQVEHIAQNWLPLVHDPLSYGGRDLVVLPLFHYLAAFWSLFLPLEIVAKILPNVLFSLLVIIVYLISKKITDNEDGSLFSAAITGFLPILFTTNAFTPLSLSLPLLFTVIYAFLSIDQKKYLYVYIVAFLLAAFASSTIFLLVIGFIIYVLLSLIEHKKLEIAEVEVILSSVFFYLWSQFIFFKEILISEGPGIIWQNIPSQIIADYFSSFSFAQALLLISLVPLITGLYTIYRALFTLRVQRSFMLISLAISTLLFSSLKLIRFRLALIFVGIIMAILFASFYKDFMEYFQKTRITKYRNIGVILLLATLLITTVYPAITTALEQEIPSQEEIEGFRWLQDHTAPGSAILGTVQEGHLITYYGQRQNLMDDQFHLIPDIEQRYSDLNSLFTTSFQTQAISLLNKYNITNLVLTPKAQQRYGLEKFNYLTKNCFQQVHSNMVKIYEVQCSLERK